MPPPGRSFATMASGLRPVCAIETNHTSIGCNESSSETGNSLLHPGLFPVSFAIAVRPSEVKRTIEGKPAKKGGHSVHSLDKIRLLASALVPNAGRLYGGAAIAAMLTCIAVVLNVGPFAN